MSFLDILQQHVHEYYRNKSMQQIYMNITFSQFYKIRSDMMEIPIHQCWGQDNLDDQKQNITGSIAISLTQTNLQLSVLSVEKQDIIIGHAQMLCPVSLSYKYMFSFTFH